MRLKNIAASRCWLVGTSAVAVRCGAAYSSIPFTGGNDQFLAGYVNEARVYRGALSPEAIRSIYEAGAVPEPGTYALLMLGASGLAWQIRRRRKD